MIAHPEPLNSVDVGNLPEVVKVIVSIHPVDDLLEFRIMSGRNPDDHPLWRLQDLWSPSCRDLKPFTYGGYFHFIAYNFLIFLLHIWSTECVF
jgi:hypothetical protein